LQQLAFYVEAATVAAQGTVGGDYAMARYYDRHWIAVVRHSDGAESLGSADGASDIGVSASLAVGNLEQGLPTFQLKRSSTKVEGEGELPSIAGEVFFQFALVRGQSSVGVLEADGTGFRAQVAWIWTYGLLSGQSGVELQGNQSLLGGSQEQRAYRRSKYRGIKGFHVMKLCVLTGEKTRFAPRKHSSAAKSRIDFAALTARLEECGENSFFAPLGLDHFPLYPRLTPWALFCRRFAARNRWPCSTR
jgi:hypothetical protein